jgi:hypothetical protein
MLEASALGWRRRSACLHRARRHPLVVFSTTVTSLVAVRRIRRGKRTPARCAATPWGEKRE